MRSVIFTAIAITSMFAISGCVSDTGYTPVSKGVQSLSNADLATSETYVVNLDKNRHEYRACLVEAYIAGNIEHEKQSPGRVSDESVKGMCAEYRDAYYTSVWASSYPLSNMNSLQFRHNTATIRRRRISTSKIDFVPSRRTLEKRTSACGFSP